MRPAGSLVVHPGRDLALERALPAVELDEPELGRDPRPARVETAAAPVVSGTGLYAGIHGTIRITESFGFIGSTYKSGPKKGRCNMSNSAPTVAQMATVYGSGAVSF